MDWRADGPFAGGGPNRRMARLAGFYGRRPAQPVSAMLGEGVGIWLAGRVFLRIMTCRYGPVGAAAGGSIRLGQRGPPDVPKAVFGEAELR